ncbi:MAG TPA: hypothetical protein VEL74_18640 [Thermoanaerobaculia bacterium]|nr:hypothetical protein [Thermoanaerobaculia bacterium]
MESDLNAARERDTPLRDRARAAVTRLLGRLRPEGPCLRCAATGAWQGGLDCPDCGGTGRR